MKNVFKLFLFIVLLITPSYALAEGIEDETQVTTIFDDAYVDSSVNMSNDLESESEITGDEESTFIELIESELENDTFIDEIETVGESEITVGKELLTINEDVDTVEAFVSRLYKNILERDADVAGLKSWTDVLKEGKEQGARVAQGFIESSEFNKRQLSSEEYVKLLYRTFFNREADDSGLIAWLSVLDSGLSRMHVFRGFAESPEFTKLCNNYGIVRGNANLTAPMDQNENVTKFVIRCYQLCLERRPDDGGLNGWCNQLLTGVNTAKEAAFGFVFSNEFVNKNLTNADYVKTLYKVFMDRESDPSGLKAWIQVLNSGKSRKHVFNGFADSAEFQKICEKYNINSGSGTDVGGSGDGEQTYEKYYDGKYKVGTDIPEGEYILFNTSEINSYYSVSKDSSGNYESIICNDIFSYNNIVSVNNGEYLDLRRCYAISIDSNPIVSTDGDGFFKIGTHLPAGEYKLISTSNISGYLVVMSGSRNTVENIITNSFFDGINYITVEEGQYLKVNRARIVH